MAKPRGKLAMALVPCNVCGTLNSENAQICLSCEYPIKGHRRPAIFQWVAIGLFALFTIPLINMALNAIQGTSKKQSSSLFTERIIASTQSSKKAEFVSTLSLSVHDPQAN
ncbi:MAG: hypothetical protein HC810_04160 [Acaryochloridaceae cyanobacterium RL_2_7]|nr:hypothetical protein [Acaryochloridaceae cyanobacterium RL_2_7]